MAASSPQTQLALTAAVAPHPRRLPPPCWSHDETAALIDAYREKWYSLRRGNLRANHWQEVADAVAAECPVNPTKTPVQCRHKMEKLRKRYRNDVNRSSARPGPGPVSSWVQFARMHAMEIGGGDQNQNQNHRLNQIRNRTYEVAIAEQEEEEDNDDDEELYQSIRQGVPNNGYVAKSGFNTRFSANTKFGNFDSNASCCGGARVVGNGYKDKFADFGPDLKSRGKRRREREVEGVAEALRALGDGYVRVERMKMEMLREVEAMRMEMEMKRTEMILEAQQRIVQAFATAVSEKKSKRMGSPES